MSVNLSDIIKKKNSVYMNNLIHSNCCEYAKSNIDLKIFFNNVSGKELAGIIYTNHYENFFKPHRIMKYK
jgi:hypothetical protein